MPLRVLLTGKLHGPDMGSSILLIHKAGSSGMVSPSTGFITIEERLNKLRDVDWAAFSKDEIQQEPEAIVSQ